MKINLIPLALFFLLTSGFSYHNKQVNKSSKTANDCTCPIKFEYYTNTTTPTSLTIDGSGGFFFTINNPTTTVPPNNLTSATDLTYVNITLGLSNHHPALRLRVLCLDTQVYCVNIPINALTPDFSLPTPLCCNGHYTIRLETGVTCP